MTDHTDTTTQVKGKRGGARAGAGRPAKKHVTVASGTPALEFLTQVYESDSVPMPLRIKAAGLVVAATVVKPGADRLGKKATARLVADDLVQAGGRFTPTRAPLAVVRKL